MPPAALGADGIPCHRGHFACDEVLQVEQVVACALGDPHQRRHPRDLFDLFSEEPLHELLAEVVALVSRDAGQPGDLLGHRALLLERHRESVARRVERVAHRVHAGNLDVHATVEQILHEHHRVIALFDRLGVEVLSQLRQIVGVEINGDRDVLLRGTEFTANLLLQEGVEFGVVCVGSRHGGEDIAGQSRSSSKVNLMQASVA